MIIMKNRIIRGNADEPVAQGTKLGYVLSGKLDIGSDGGHQINLNESLVTNVNYGMLTEEHNCLIENKILGLKWDKFEDNFAFDLTEVRQKFDVILTKRNVIKAIASIYDSLGFLNPIVVQIFPKVMLTKI